MLIRTKLLMSYIAMIVLPIILFILAFTLFLLLLDRFDQHETYGRISMSVNFSTSDNNEKLFSKLIETIEKDPDIIQNRSQLNTIEKKFKLKHYQTGIIIQKDRKIFYASPSVNTPEFWKYLPRYQSFTNEPTIFTVKGRSFTLKMHLFLFPDKIPGAIYLISDITDILRQVFFIVIVIVGLLFLSLIIANGMLTLVVSRSILKPLFVLKTAAQRMSTGDLDVQVKSLSKDELGELAVTFDEMRCRLKESINSQLQYEKNRKDLISGISHDLKTPITAIKGYIEGIRDGVADSPEKFEKYIQTIHTKAGHLDGMIDELFLFSKLDLGKLPFHFNRIDFKMFMEDILDEITFELKEKGIVLAVDITCCNEAIVIADRDHLRRVVMNMIENSIKHLDYSKPIPEIRVSLKQQDQWISVAITDNGLGIKPEVLPHIFERFYRADPSRNSETGGSGLGLSIVKRIIEEHHGTIEVESVFGQGSTFRFSLQLVKNV